MAGRKAVIPCPGQATGTVRRIRRKPGASVPFCEKSVSDLWNFCVRFRLYLSERLAQDGKIGRARRSQNGELLLRVGNFGIDHLQIDDLRLGGIVKILDRVTFSVDIQEFGLSHANLQQEEGKQKSWA
jgi:hypothetical protein